MLTVPGLLVIVLVETPVVRVVVVYAPAVVPEAEPLPPVGAAVDIDELGEDVLDALVGQEFFRSGWSHASPGIWTRPGWPLLFEVVVEWAAD